MLTFPDYEMNTVENETYSTEKEAKQKPDLISCLHGDVLPELDQYHGCSFDNGRYS